MCQNGHEFWRFRNQKTLRKEKSANEPLDTKFRKTSQNGFHLKLWILLLFWENVRINLIFVLEEVSWTDTGQMRAGNRSTIVQLSFNDRSLNWKRSNESRQSFNYRSTTVQLSFAIVHWAETGQMRAGNRSTIVQLPFNDGALNWNGSNESRKSCNYRATCVPIIVQACVALSWFWGAFWEFCSVLPFLCFCDFYNHKRGRTTRNSENDPGRSETLLKLNRCQAIFGLKLCASIFGRLSANPCTAKSVRFYPP